MVLVLLPSLYADEKTWTVPPAKVCFAHNGFYDYRNKLCEARLEDGIQMCKEINASVATIDDYIKLSRACGATVDYANSKKRDNADNESYQVCIKKRGFNSVYQYVSSTKLTKKRIMLKGNYNEEKTQKLLKYYENFTFGNASLDTNPPLQAGFISCVRE